MICTFVTTVYLNLNEDLGRNWCRDLMCSPKTFNTHTAVYALDKWACHFDFITYVAIVTLWLVRYIPVLYSHFGI